MHAASDTAKTEVPLAFKASRPLLINHNCQNHAWIEFEQMHIDCCIDTSSHVLCAGSLCIDATNGF